MSRRRSPSRATGRTRTAPAPVAAGKSRGAVGREPERSSFESLTSFALVCVGLVALVVFVFAPVRHNGFITLDDPIYVSENPFIRHGLTWSSVAWAFTTGRTGNWHPLTWISHILDVQWFGLNPGPQHLVSLALHVANTLLVFGVLASMTGARWRSAAVAALFGVHPLHVQSVAWIAERKDVLSTLFWWVSMGAYVRWTRRPSSVRFAGVVSAYALGLLAKPMVLTLPIVLIGLDLWPLRRLAIDAWTPFMADLRARLIEKIPLFAVGALSAVVTFIAQRAGGAVTTLTILPFDRRLANAAVSYVAYLGKMIWPTRLAIYYPFPQTSEWVACIAAVLVLTAVTVGTVRCVRSAPYLLVGWLWYVITLLPVIGIVQVGSQAMADRYTYVPLVGPFIALVWAAADLAGRYVRGRPLVRQTVLGAVAGLIVAACSGTARAQTAYWADSASVWRHALDVTADNYVAREALGAILVEQGQLDEGIRQLDRALGISSDLPDAHYNLGIAYMRQGDNTRAEAAYREALRLEPPSSEAAGVGGC